MRVLLFCLTLSVTVSSCDTTHNAGLLVGEWKGAQWLVDGKPSTNDAATTSFRFESDGNYTYTYAGTVEKGLYKVDDENLYTRPNGGVEIMVHVAKLTKDSLVFDMNRSGRAETLTLLKK